MVTTNNIRPTRGARSTRNTQQSRGAQPHNPTNTPVSSFNGNVPAKQQNRTQDRMNLENLD